jgi:hypothetical protein
LLWFLSLLFWIGWQGLARSIKENCHHSPLFGEGLNSSVFYKALPRRYLGCCWGLSVSSKFMYWRLGPQCGGLEREWDL